MKLDADNFMETMQGARDAATVKRVFGDPIERNGVTIIPTAMVGSGGGGGGGAGEHPENGPGEGGGLGWGWGGRPAGVYVVRGDSVEWVPAIDRNRMVMAAAMVATTALLVVGRGLRRRRRRR